MAQVTINNLDTGLVARTAINDNFTELYNQTVRLDTSAQISTLSAKGTPVAADLLIIEDSEDSNSKKKITLDNVIDLKTYENGITESSNVVKLGGSLTSNTDIDVDSYDFSISSTNDGTFAWSIADAGTNVATFDINSIDSTYAQTDGTVFAGFTITKDSVLIQSDDNSNKNYIQIDNNDASGIKVQEAINSKGLYYAADYTANFSARSLVDKDYVDTKLNSWLTGTLTGNTTVTNANSYIFKISAGDGADLYTEVQIDESGFVCLAEDADGEFSTELISQVTDGIRAQSVLKSTNTTGDASLDISTSTGMVFTDEINTKGVVYAADYSTNYTDRSLVDKGWVDAQIAAISSDRIQDSGTTTYVDTDEQAGIVVAGSVNSGTDYIFKAIADTGGTPAENFQIDGDGNLYNDGDFQLVRKDTSSLYIGTSSTHAGMSTVTESVFAGYLAGTAITTGDSNVGIGTYALTTLTTGSSNTAVGRRAGYSGNSKTNDCYFGRYSGFRHTGNGSIFLGNLAGQWQTTTSDLLIIDNQDRSNIAGELTDCLIVGNFNATAANQELRLNAKVCAGGVGALTNQAFGDMLLEGGSLILKEITTPTADANYGKVYTKNDNKLYFQDGGGTEHEIAFV